MSDKHPQAEEYVGAVNCTGRRACYDEGKRASEALFFDYHRQYKVEIRVARIFNTYGPRMSHDDGRVIPNFITQALQGSPITIYGDGSQSRSFCYIDDLVEGIYRLLMSDYVNPVNIGNPAEISIKDFAEEIVKLSGTSSKIVYKELPVDDPKQRRPDISKAKEILGWEPKVSRLEGLRITFHYFQTLPEFQPKTESVS